MLIRIICSQYEAQVLRDAIQDKYHELKNSPSDRGQLNAILCNFVAKRMSQAMMVDHPEAIHIDVPDLIRAADPNATHNPNPASPLGKKPQVLPEQKQVRRVQKDSTLPIDKSKTNGNPGS